MKGQRFTGSLGQPQGGWDLAMRIEGSRSWAAARAHLSTHAAPVAHTVPGRVVATCGEEFSEEEVEVGGRAPAEACGAFFVVVVVGSIAL